jgi:hypothetical protein
MGSLANGEADVIAVDDYRPFLENDVRFLKAKQMARMLVLTRSNIPHSVLSDVG